MWNKKSNQTMLLLKRSILWVPKKIASDLRIGFFVSETKHMYAEVVIHEAGSLEAVGLPGYPQLFIGQNKRVEVLTK